MSLKLLFSRNKSVILFTALLFYLYFRGIGDHGLLDPLEGLNASISLHMSATGNYFEPHLGSSLSSGKSLGYWWLTSISLKIFGWGEFSVRFFSVLSALGMILTSAYASKRFHDDDTNKSWLGASIAASMTICYVVSQIAVSNALFSFLSGLIMFGLIKSQNNKSWLILSHASLVLSLISYGYEGIILTVLSIFIFSFAVRDYEMLKNFFSFLPAVVISIIGVGIYLLILIAVNPLMLHFLRCENPGLPNVGLTGTIISVFVSFLPWNGFLIRAFCEVITNFKKFLPSEDFENENYEQKRVLESEQEDFEKRVFQQRFFLIVWGSVYGLAAVLTGNFLSIAACVVPFSALLGDLIHVWLQKGRFYSIAFSLLADIFAILFTIFILLPLGIFVFPIFKASVMSLIPWSLCLILFLFATWYYTKTKQVAKWTRNVIAVSLLCLMPLAGVFDLIAEVNAIKTPALAIRGLIQKDDIIIQYWENHPSIYFYTYRDSQIINAPLINGVNQKSFLTNDQTLNSLWRGKTRVFLLIPSDKPLQKVLPANIFSITEANGNLLLSNQ